MKLDLKYLVGEQKTVWFQGEKYMFQYVGNGEWTCISDQEVISYEVRKALSELLE